MLRLGLPSVQERERIQKEFCERKIQVVVATLAFGMGLDVTHVRSVVHLNLPRSLEEYVQQVQLTASVKLTFACLAWRVDPQATVTLLIGLISFSRVWQWFLALLPNCVRADTCLEHKEHAWLGGVVRDQL